MLNHFSLEQPHNSRALHTSPSNHSPVQAHSSIVLPITVGGSSSGTRVSCSSSDGALVRTDEERGAGLGEVVEAVAAEDVAEHEGQHEHGDLKQDADAGNLLLLPGRGRRRRQPSRGGRRRQVELQRHLPPAPLRQKP
jgi:hypothetical protein